MRWIGLLLLAGGAAAPAGQDAPVPGLNLHQDFRKVRLKLDQAADEFNRLCGIELPKGRGCLAEDEEECDPFDPDPWLEPASPAPFAPGWRRAFYR